MSLTIHYTANAQASGGRNGHTENADKVVSVDLSIPKSMGGPGKAGTTTPEDLFAAGYAACFGSACEFVSKPLKLSPTHIAIAAAVGIGSRSEGGFGLQVALTATITGLSQADAERLVAAAHQACPYSNATRNNIEVTLTTHVA